MRLNRIKKLFRAWMVCYALQFAKFYYNCFILQNTSKALKRETKLYKNLVLKQNAKFTIKI